MGDFQGIISVIQISIINICQSVFTIDDIGVDGASVLQRQCKIIKPITIDIANAGTGQDFMIRNNFYTLC